jgi:hypothetical protein
MVDIIIDPLRAVPTTQEAMVLAILDLHILETVGSASRLHSSLPITSPINNNSIENRKRIHVNAFDGDAITGGGATIARIGRDGDRV